MQKWWDCIQDPQQVILGGAFVLAKSTADAVTAVQVMAGAPTGTMLASVISTGIDTAVATQWRNRILLPTDIRTRHDQIKATLPKP